MLSPPLSHLSCELLARVVEHLADDTDNRAAKRLKRLSVVDRAFTLICQSHLFQVLELDGNKSRMTKTLQTVHEILKSKESPAISFVRRIRLGLDHQKDPSWLFQDSTFLSLMAILSKAPRPPYELQILYWNGSTTKNPELIVRGLANSFLSQSLRSLAIWKSQIPARTLLVSSGLKRLELTGVHFIGPGKSAKDDNTQVDDRLPPRLQVLDHRTSFDVVQRMLAGEGAERVADLSQLRVLHMSPEDEENMALAQPILDVAHATIEEIYLQHHYVTDPEGQLPLFYGFQRFSIRSHR